MSFQTIKRTARGAAGVLALLSVSAQAADVYYQGSIVSQATDIEFSGSNVDLSQGSLNITCDLTLIGDVESTSSGGAVITVTDGSVSGPVFSGCNSVSLGFPWTATVDAADAPDPAAGGTTIVTFDNVEVTTWVGTCSGSASATFTNGATVTNNAPSSFEFADAFDGCTVEGTIYTQSPYGTHDVDVY